MSNFKINNRSVDAARKNISFKKSIWEKRFPHLSFDEDGRAIIGEVPLFDKDTLDMTIRANCSDEFTESLLEACEHLKIEPFHLENISYNDFARKKIEVRYKNGTVREKRLTSILSLASSIWEEKNPLYRPLATKLRSINKNSTDENKINNAKYIIDSFKSENFFMKYDDLLREFQPKPMILSINPLDKLFTSGESSGNHPTKFRTCLSVRLDKISEDEIECSSLGDYSNPSANVILGEHPLNGVLFLPNSNEISVCGMKFFGMVQRSHVWMQNESIVLENLYPDKENHNRARSLADTLTQKHNIKCIFGEYTSEELCVPKEFNSKKWVSKYLSELDSGNSLYLDRSNIYNSGKIIINE